MKNNLLLLEILIFFFLLISCSFAQVKAFPQAEGAGKFTTGGRGGTVIEVTNLNDSGTGSLRAAIEANGPRIVVFRVSGYIDLQSALKIQNDDITIAGQTAPGDGICIRNYTVRIAASNVILRFIRFRLGDDYGQEEDSIWGRENDDVIIDHCTMSWSVDESASFYDNHGFTMQWCMITESLDNSIHSKGPHGYGGIWGGAAATFHHNLIAHHTSRNPRFNGSRYTTTPETEVADFVNNVIYNWRDNSVYGGEAGNYNIRYNYYKSGPATSGDVRGRIVEPYDTSGNWFITGNYVDDQPVITNDNWLGVQGSYASYQRNKKAMEPFEIEEIEMQTADEAFDAVLDYSGVCFPVRDSVDSRVSTEARTGTASYGVNGLGIIDKPEDVGGYPVLNSSTPLDDADHDGMPDGWEQTHGLNPNDASDRNNLSPEGYTMVEVYINELVTHTYPDYVNPVEETEVSPKDFSISGNYPNPFNMGTVISFAVNKPGNLNFEIFSVAGERVKGGTITFDAAGVKEFYWNSYGEKGNGLSSGIYFVKAIFNGSIQTHKMILLK